VNSLSSGVTRALAALLLVTAAPAYSNGSSCGFSTSGNAGMTFGTLNQIAGGTLTATATLQVGDCNSQQAMLVTVNNPVQTMTRISGTETITYSVTNGSFAPLSAAGLGNNIYKTVTITGTILPGAYLDAVAGSYSGSVTVSVSP
jgi:hypothetical protein